MNARDNSFRSALLTVAALVAVGTAVAAPPAAAPEAKQAVDPAAMMEIYMKAATPGPEHQELAKLVGSWKLEVTSWMAPGMPPDKSEATAKFESILGGRFLRQTVHGDMGGQPFEGMGIEGFDNVSKERWGIWVDTMGTGGMMSRGPCAVGAKTCTMTGSMSDPATGTVTSVREVLTRTSDDAFTFDMYGPDPGGKEFHMMQIVYTRQ